MLRENNVEVSAVDYTKTKLDAPAVRAIVKAVGSVAGVLNARHALAKDRGWIERPPTVDDFVEEAVRDANLLKRPVLVHGETVLVGFHKANADAWRAVKPPR